MNFILPMLNSLIPAILFFFGGLLGRKFYLRKKVLSSFQHFVSGFLIASIAVELLPHILQTTIKLKIAIGFAAGVIIMLLNRAILHYFSSSQKISISFGLFFAVSVDIFIDGILVGISYISGFKGSLLIAVAIAFCMITLGFTTMGLTRERQISRNTQKWWLFLSPILLPIGTIAGILLVDFFPKILLVEVLAFGIAALLYLAIEELLFEAHKIEETPLVTSLFFLGFILILLI